MQGMRGLCWQLTWLVQRQPRDLTRQVQHWPCDGEPHHAISVPELVEDPLVQVPLLFQLDDLPLVVQDCQSWQMAPFVFPRSAVTRHEDGDREGRDQEQPWVQVRGTIKLVLKGDMLQARHVYHCLIPVVYVAMAFAAIGVVPDPQVCDEGQGSPFRPLQPRTATQRLPVQHSSMPQARQSCH